MRHDWIFDVLRDLRAYAQTNGLPALALKAEEALRVACAEVAAPPAALQTCLPSGLPQPSHGPTEPVAEAAPVETEAKPASGRPH